LTHCDTCEAGDAVTECAQACAVDAADDSLFQCIVHGKVLLEEGEICCMLVDNDGCVGNGGACWDDWCGSWVGRGHESDSAEHVAADCWGDSECQES